MPKMESDRDDWAWSPKQRVDALVICWKKVPYLDPRTGEFRMMPYALASGCSSTARALEAMRVSRPAIACCWYSGLSDGVSGPQFAREFLSQWGHHRVRPRLVCVDTQFNRTRYALACESGYDECYSENAITPRKMVDLIKSARATAAGTLG